MAKKEQKMEETKYKKINWQKILGALWKKKILIALISILCAAVMAIGTYLFVMPEYQSDILVYVNNTSVSHENFTSGELTAARQVLNTYLVVLYSRQCLNKVIEKANLPYSSNQLKKMISAGAVNDTECFSVVVTSKNPNEARVIADTIGEVFPGILTEKITGSDVEVIDRASQPGGKVSPNLTKAGAIGFVLGMLWTGAFVCIREMLDNKIHDENTLKELYDTIPVLANIPYNEKSGSYSKYGYGYGYERKRG